MSKSVKPLISIVTVVYNNKNAIEKTILSVINQNYKDIEYIIIDGKSTDGTTDIINKYAPRINQIISEPDNGIYDAMNKGIDLATGDYIIFMNSGDMFYNNNVISDIFDDFNNDDIIFGNVIVNFRAYSSLKKASYPSEINPMSFCHQAVFVKSIILKNNKFDVNYKICSDKNQFFQIYSKKPTYKYFNTTISTIEAFGASNVNRIATLKEIKTIYKLNNINNNFFLNFNIFKGYCLSIIEYFLGKKIINKLRRLKYFSDTIFNHIISVLTG